MPLALDLVYPADSFDILFFGREFLSEKGSSTKDVAGDIDMGVAGKQEAGDPEGAGLRREARESMAVRARCVCVCVGGWGVS